MSLTVAAAAASSSSSTSLGLQSGGANGASSQRLIVFSSNKHVDLRNVHSRSPKHLVAASIGKSGLFTARISVSQRRAPSRFTLCTASVELDTSGGGNDAGAGGSGSGGGGGGGGDGAGDGSSSDKNRTEALLALASLGRSLDNIPRDLAYAIQDGRVTAAIVERFVVLEKTPLRGWLMRFSGFMERLLADDLFLTKVFIECGVGIFTKTAAELERRKDRFSKELDFVFADIVMALIADFMLVWLPAPTISLRAAPAMEAGRLAKFFYGCPDNAFQVAIRGTSYSLLQRVGAIARNGAKLLGVGTAASLVGTGVTNGLISIRKSLDKNFAGEADDVPIFSTSLAYGVYMAVSSNLRYQILAGVIEQRFLEPMLHNKKLALSVLCFAVRTGNTFLGSLMWVDYARWVGVQKIRE